MLPRLGIDRVRGLSDSQRRVWRARIQVVWIAFGGAFTVVATLFDGTDDTDRRIVVLLASGLAVVVFAVILVTLVFASSDVEGSARDVLIVAFAAGLFVATSSLSLGVVTTAAVAAAGSVAIGVVAVLPHDRFEFALSSLTMLLGVPALMVVPGIVLHAGLVYLPGFDANILFLPTTLTAFAGLLIGLAFDRIRDDRWSGRPTVSPWHATMAVMYVGFAAWLAYDQPHGWAQSEHGGWSALAAATWLVVLLPLVVRLVRQTRPTDQATVQPTTLQAWNGRWRTVAWVAALGGVHAVSVSLIHRAAAGSDARYDLMRTIGIETSTAALVAFAAIWALHVLVVGATAEEAVAAEP